MKQKKIKLHLNRLQWDMLREELKAVVAIAPVKEWALQSHIMVDLYVSKMAFFEFYPYSADGVKLSLTQIQAIAINEYLAPRSSKYNVLLRLELEPQLKLGI